MVMFLKWFLMGYMFFMGSVAFVLSRKHLLSTLLSLEFMVLSLFFMLLSLLNGVFTEMYFSMMFLTFSVCEGALGVAILVSMIRTHGNDFFNSFSVLQC